MDPAHRPGDYLSAFARLFKIDEALRAGGRVNHATLAKNLGVSVRTIQRDFDYLRDSLRAPVDYDAKTKSWAYTERTFFLPSLLATADDLLALLLIHQAIEQYAGTPYAEAAQRAFALVEKALPEEGRLAAEWVKSRVAFTDFPPPEIPAEVWHAVLESLRTSRSLEISYAKPGEPAQSREVDPYGLIVSEGDWYLYTHDRERNARRTFLLTRIERAKVTGDSYRIPADFDLTAYVREGFGGLQADGEPVRTVRITFTREASAAVAERKWHPDQRESWDGAGRLTIELEARAPFQLRRRLASFAAEIESFEWSR